MRVLVYGIIKVNKKGEREIEVLRPFRDEALVFKAGVIKRNLNQAKFGLASYEAGEIVVCAFSIVSSGGYEKLQQVYKESEMKMANDYVRIVIFGVTSQLDSAVLKSVDAIYQGMGAVLGLTASATLRAKKEMVVGLPLPVDKAQEIIKLLPFPAYHISSDVVQAAPAPIEVAPVAPVVDIESGYYWVSPEANLLLSGAAHTLKAFGGLNSSVAIALLGASGYGKTSLAKRLATKLGFEFVRVNCALISEPDEIAVQRIVSGGSTGIELKRFAKVLMGGNAVIILDELNRAYPNVLAALFALLDGEGEQEFLGEKITVGDNVIFVATMNVGTEYTGTFKADRALLNRFLGWITLDAMPAKEEIKVLCSAYNSVSNTDASEIVSVANGLRMTIADVVEVSTRTTLAIAMFVAAGMTVRQAFEYVVVQAVESEERRQVIDSINMKLGSFTPNKSNFKLLL